MKYRKLNILTHRYLGYYFFALTIVYSISGLAVNHMESWNSNYIINKKQVSVAPLKKTDDITDQEIKEIFSKLEIDKPYNKDNVFYPSDSTIEIIISEGEKVSINTEENKTLFETIKKRPILHTFNFLHLNNPKKLWTWYADFYAFSLFLLAVTGMFMKKGKEGILGKGGILAIIGIVIPIICLFMYY